MTSLPLVALAAIVLLSTVVHEAGHALAARMVGWRVRGIRLHPLGVGLKVEVGENPRDVWKVALGGLLATAWLALCFLALAPVSLYFAAAFATNAGLLLTNMLPFKRLDGGMVLRGIRA